LGPTELKNYLRLLRSIVNADKLCFTASRSGIPSGKKGKNKNKTVCTTGEMYAWQAEVELTVHGFTGDDELIRKALQTPAGFEGYFLCKSKEQPSSTQASSSPGLHGNILNTSPVAQPPPDLPLNLHPHPHNLLLALSYLYLYCFLAYHSISLWASAFSC